MSYKKKDRLRYRLRRGSHEDTGRKTGHLPAPERVLRRNQPYDLSSQTGFQHCEKILLFPYDHQDNLFWRLWKKWLLGYSEQRTTQTWFDWRASHLYSKSWPIHTENFSNHLFFLRSSLVFPASVSAYFLLRPPYLPNAASKRMLFFVQEEMDFLESFSRVLGSRHRGLSVPIRFRRFQAPSCHGLLNLFIRQVSLPVMG